MIVVLASNNGSNYEAIIKYGIEDTLLICENPNAYVIKRAINLKQNYIINDINSFENRHEYNRELFSILEKLDPQLIVLAGYMKIIPKNIVDKYTIINIHPALLPAFKGNNAISDAYSFGVKVTGITIHLIDHNIDEGKILYQHHLNINENDSLSAVETKIHNLEHKYYPYIIDKLIKGELNEKSID